MSTTGHPDPDELITLTLILRRRCEAPDPDTIGRYLSHGELAEMHGADPVDIQAVENFASEHGFSIVSIHAAARTVVLGGRRGDLAKAFAAGVSCPQLDGRIIAIVGLDSRPVVRTYHTFRPLSSRAISYTPLQVAQLYNFPPASGAKQTIALIELGGGFDSSDVNSYWQQLGLNSVQVSAVSVDGASNDPTGDPNGPDGEVVLDIEIAGAVAPEAKIAVYFAPNSDQGFLSGINAAIHDTVRKPSIISISWGSAESEWTPQSLNAFNAAFHDAALLGISVCVAAGDDGSSDGESDGRVHVDFPASSPWVLACGGTSLIGSGGEIESEVVWNDGAKGGATGGGVSSHFSGPKYQANVQVPKPTGTVNKTGRGVPDVAGVADPDTGFEILVDGQQGVVGGTSAVAPLWAGLIARLNQQLGRNLGWFHPALYGEITQQQALRDITSGKNGAYKAGIGWDPCTGLGTPNGEAILNALK
jgi:kumamolisin